MIRATSVDLKGRNIRIDPEGPRICVDLKDLQDEIRLGSGLRLTCRLLR